MNTAYNSRKASEDANTRLRALVIATDNHPSSGAFLSMATLCKLLIRDQNVEPLVVLPRSGAGEKLLREMSISYVHIRSFSWVRSLGQNRMRSIIEQMVKRPINALAIWRIRRLIQHWKPSVVHTNTIYSYVGIRAAQRAGIPHIWHIRELLEVGQGKTLWNTYRGEALIAQSDYVIAISDCVAREYARFVPPERLITILNGVDETIYHQKAKLVLESDVPKLFYGGGYDSTKGFDELITALEKLKGLHSFELFLLGDVPSNIPNKLHAARILENTHLLGYRNDVPSLLNNMDISFCTSAFEAFGRKTVEGMMAGVLVIAADTGATLELVQHGKTGLLYRQGNADDLSKMMLESLNYPEKSRLIAQNGRQYALGHLTATRNASEIAALYRTISRIKENLV